MSASNVRPHRMGGRSPRGNRNVSSKPDLALAVGYVVVSSGCRGRDNQAADGTYYGKAPAATTVYPGCPSSSARTDGEVAAIAASSLAREIAQLLCEEGQV